MKLNHPALVRREYADEERFSVRPATWNGSTGPNAHDLVVFVAEKR